ncbi:MULTISPECIES: hypothetical protein [unclassified Pseudomonas]|uniref:hypothetical protein n=1 Tax=Pseudomonas sp. WS 5503 TaxID=2717497 RepID=UPI0005BEAF8F|nr:MULTISPECIES: hypothetical protein [unclassified Pseudomonas]AJO77644.1 hypothetical protein TO66_10135 [Pseudomonas sp. MRSN 12121]
MPEHASPERERPTMASHRLDLPSRCDICGNARSTRKHQLCSRIRQQTKTAEWAAFMAEREAAKQNKPRRYAH